MEIPRARHSPHWYFFHSEDAPYVLHLGSSSIFALTAEQGNIFLNPTCTETCPCRSWHAHLSEQTPDNLPRTPSVISTIALTIAEKCNLRCAYCYAGEGNYGADRLMSFAQAQAAINYFLQFTDSLHVIFFGGEPLLNFSLITKIVHWSKQLKGKTISFGLTTNGTLLTAPIREYLAKNAFAVKVSYDGPAWHEQQRKSVEGANFDRRSVEDKLAAWQQQVAQLRKLIVRSTITRDVAQNFAEFLPSLITSHQYRIAWARVSSADAARQLQWDDINAIKRSLTRVVEAFLAAGEFASILRLESLRKHIRNFYKRRPQQGFCGAGISYLSVASNGNFYLCHRFTNDREEQVGSIAEGVDWQKLEKINKLRTAELPPCNTCWMRSYCAGGCMHENKMQRGDSTAIDPKFCSLQETEMLLALQVICRIRSKQPEFLDREFSIGNFN